MKWFVSCVLLVFSFFLKAQLSCESAQYLRESRIKVESSGQEAWYKFRAKGNLLTFLGGLEQKDSLFEYEIYPFSDCSKLEKGAITPLRSVTKNGSGLTEELWQKVIDEGICACGSCLAKIETDKTKPLKVNQGDLYLLKVLSAGQPFSFNLSYSEIDTLNPVKFSIDSVSIEEVELGMVYQLKEIFFVPGTPSYIPQSLPELKKLEAFLKKHEVLKVQVRGHVNGHNNSKPEHYQNLSNQRAEAIKKFLIDNGVDEDRVDAKGMSNFQMRYLSPKNAFEAGENRRVEIVIVAVE